MVAALTRTLQHIDLVVPAGDAARFGTMAGPLLPALVRLAVPVCTDWNFLQKLRVPDTVCRTWTRLLERPEHLWLASSCVVIRLLPLWAQELQQPAAAAAIVTQNFFASTAHSQQLRRFARLDMIHTARDDRALAEARQHCLGAASFGTNFMTAAAAAVQQLKAEGEGRTRYGRGKRAWLRRCRRHESEDDPTTTATH
jgi:hypothetical protein